MSLNIHSESPTFLQIIMIIFYQKRLLGLKKKLRLLFHSKVNNCNFKVNRSKESVDLFEVTRQDEFRRLYGVISQSKLKIGIEQIRFTRILKTPFTAH